MTPPFALRAPRKKYGNRRTEYAGVTYDSAKEARRAAELDLLLRAGDIADLQRQKTYPLDVNGVPICRYRADFVYRRGADTIVEDVKGFKTPEYKIKAALMKAVFNIEVREV